MYKMLKCVVLLALLLTAGWTATAQPDWSAADPSVVGKFEDEGLQHETTFTTS